MTALIEARGLTCGYGKLPVVRGLDLTVEAGEVVCLLGANGAGKTTTLRMIAGALPRLGGSVMIAGKPAPAAAHIAALGRGEPPPASAPPLDGLPR